VARHKSFQLHARVRATTAPPGVRPPTGHAREYLRRPRNFFIAHNRALVRSGPPRSGLKLRLSLAFLPPSAGLLAASGNDTPRVGFKMAPQDAPGRSAGGNVESSHLASNAPVQYQPGQQRLRAPQDWILADAIGTGNHVFTPNVNNCFLTAGRLVIELRVLRQGAEISLIEGITPLTRRKVFPLRGLDSADLFRGVPSSGLVKRVIQFRSGHR